MTCGQPLMPEWLAGSWDIQELVSIVIHNAWKESCTNLKAQELRAYDGTNPHCTHCTYS